MTFVAYLVGKPVQLCFVGDLVIAAFKVWRFGFTAVDASAVFILVCKCSITRIVVTALAGVSSRRGVVNLFAILRLPCKHGACVFAKGLPPNLRGSFAKVTLQLVRHRAVLELEFGFGCAICAVGSIANSVRTCPRKVIAVFHLAGVFTANTADIFCAGNIAGVIASVHRAVVAAVGDVVVITAHAADFAPFAGNIAGVIASVHSVFVLTAHAADTFPCAGNRAGIIASVHSVVVLTANAADKLCARNRMGVITFFQDAIAVPAAHAADTAEFAGNRTGNLAGVIAFLHSAFDLRAAHAADIICAGNRIGVIAFLQGAVGAVLTAHAADNHCAGNRAVVMTFFHSAAFDIAAHTADLLTVVSRAGNIAFVMASFHSAVSGVLTAHAADSR